MAAFCHCSSCLLRHTFLFILDNIDFIVSGRPWVIPSLLLMVEKKASTPFRWFQLEKLHILVTF